MEAAIINRQLALWDLVPAEIEICIGYAFAKTHNPRQFVHVHAIQQ